jgi:hypothetical protein
MALRPLNGERRNATIRAATALDAVEKPEAQTDLRSLVDVMQAVIDAQAASIATMQAIIDAATAALADMDVVIAGVDASTNAQLRTMVKNIAQAMKDRIRDVKNSAQNDKSHSGEVKDMARAIKRTIRLVA